MWLKLFTIFFIAMRMKAKSEPAAFVALEKQYPFFPYLLVFVSGIIFPSTLSNVQACVAFTLLAFSLCWVFTTRFCFQKKTCIILFFFFLAGVCRFYSESRLQNSILSRPIHRTGLTYEGEVVGYPELRPYGSRMLVHIRSRKNKGAWEPFIGRARVSFLGRLHPERGDTIRFQSVLRRPRNFGNEYEFNFEQYAFNRNINWLASVTKDERWVRVRSSENPIRRQINALRQQAVDRAEQFLSEDAYSLFKSMVLGDKGEMAPELQESFRRSGLVHLLVVSGFHVGVVAAVFAGFLSLVIRQVPQIFSRVPIWHIRIIGGLMGATIFVSIANLPVSTLRAFLVLLVSAFLLILRRTRDPLSIIGLLFFGFLVYQPFYLFDVSFQLSFGAVVGILAAVRLFKPERTGITPLSRVRFALSVSFLVVLGATVATAPILVFHFSRFSLLSIPGNLIFVPTIGVISIVLGLAGTFFIGSLLEVGNFFFSVLDVWLGFSIPVLKLFSQTVGGDLWVPRPSWFSFVGYVLLLATGITRLRLPGFQRRARLGFIAGSVLLLLPVFLNFLLFRNKDSKVHFLHVGQGDAIVVRSMGKALLVDAGPGGPHSFDAGESVVLPWLRSHGVERLDVMAITHGDSDHIGGARSVLENMEVKEIWYAGGAALPLAQEVKKVALKKGTSWILIRKAERSIPFGSIRIEILHPPDPLNLFHVKENDRSLVVRIKSESHSVLLTGDIEYRAEQLLVKERDQVKADVLKVAHHGSRTSTSKSFLGAVQPTQAVVSAGFANRYGHPSPKVLRRLENLGVRVWRGDLCGEIVASLCQGSISLSSVRDCGN